jgi:hypothetical protein
MAYMTKNKEQKPESSTVTGQITVPYDPKFAAKVMRWSDRNAVSHAAANRRAFTRKTGRTFDR